MRFIVALLKKSDIQVQLKNGTILSKLMVGGMLIAVVLL